MPQTSWPGSPSIIQLASARPTPPPWLKPAITPQATQKFFRPLTGPISGLPSGAKVKGPLTTLRMPAVPSAGKCWNAVSRLGAMRSRSLGSRFWPKSHGVSRSLQGCAGLLVGADQHAAALLAHVDLALEVDDVELVDLGIDDAGNVLGDEVMVLHREDRQFEPDHAADLARPEAAAVDDVLGEDVALLGDDVPGAVRARLEIDDAVEAVDLGAARGCAHLA